MVFERIITQDLMHYSYFVADEGKALVIDPRLDYGIYLELAEKHQVKISGIFETHRNEDIRSGAGALGAASGAPVFVSGFEELPYEYGEKISGEEPWELSSTLSLVPLHTPGHTLGHLSYLLRVNQAPYLVFTGDCLFYGGVGRTDFYGEDRLTEMTTLLHESIYDRLKPLGEEILIFPAHGPGSACGDSIEERPFSTLGYELKHNEALSESRDEFLRKNARMRYKNAAFVFMELQNLKSQGVENVRLPYGGETEGSVILDLRPREAFQAQHLPGAISIPAGLVSSYTGWFLTQDQAITLMADGVSHELVKEAVQTLIHQGYEHISTVLGTGTLYKQRTSGNLFEGLAIIRAADYLKSPQGITLDVRRVEELKEDDPVGERIHIPLQELKGRLGELDGLNKEPLYVLCRSAERATVAASFIQANTSLRPVVIEGGISALKSLRKD